MRFLIAAAAATFVLAVPAFATPDDEQTAIVACRTAIAGQAGVEDSRDAVRFNRIQRTPGGFDIRFRVRRPDDGLLSRVDCHYDRAAQVVQSVDLAWRASEVAATEAR